MNNKINRILCPTDFSDAAINAVEYAAHFAKKNNATLTLWNMNELFVKETKPSVLVSNRINEQYEQNHQILQDWSEQITNEFDIKCDYAVVEDQNNLQKTLDNYLDGEHFDLMVSGTNGVSSMFQFHFGTNSYNILNRSKIPVLVVPSTCTFDGINSVVYLMDYKDGDVDNVKSLVDVFKAPVTALHVSEHGNEVSHDVFKAHANIMDSALVPDYNINYTRVINKNTQDGLSEYLERNKTELIVLSHLNRDRIDSLFHKSFTKSIVETIGYPVLVLNEKRI